MSGFSANRLCSQLASPAHANGFLPPIGNAAGLPVSAFRCVQRIAEEWLTWKCAAAAARLTPLATAATTRLGKSGEYGAPMHAGLLSCLHVQSNITPRRYPPPRRFSLKQSRSNVLYQRP